MQRPTPKTAPSLSARAAIKGKKMPVQDTNAASIRSLGRRKSNFPAIDNIPDDTTLDFVSDGVNYKITKADFLTALNVIGTIVQDGDPTGTPVLDTQGTVHNIRNLENGPGVKASVSAQNGITLEHNFDFDSAGAPLSPDATLDMPVLRSIVAGAGISVSGIGNTIVIAESATPVSIKTVIVSQLSDFPTPVASVITLASDTQYQLVNDVNIGVNRFIAADNCVVAGSDSSVIALTYTGTGDMFTGTAVDFRVGRITLSAVNGRVFNMSDVTATKLFQVIDMTISGCKDVASITGYAAAQINNVAMTFSQSGITFTGTMGAFVSNTILGIATTTGSIFDLTGATLNSFTDSNSIYFLLNAATVLLKGDAASANITTLGTLANSRVSGPGTALSGITATDAKWQFALNDAIQDTRTDALLSLQGNSTNTVIAVATTPVKVAGTWVVEFNSQMTGDTTGRATLDTVKKTKLPVTASVSIEPVSGGAQDISCYIALNGVIEAGSQRTATTSPGSPISITIPWQINADPADFIEIWVANDAGTTDLLASSAVFRVN